MYMSLFFHLEEKNMSKKTIRKPAFLGKYNWKAILPWIFQIAVVLALGSDDVYFLLSECDYAGEQYGAEYRNRTASADE